MHSAISIAKNLPFTEMSKDFPDNFLDVGVHDPPYGINFSAYKRTNLSKKTAERYISNGKKTWDKKDGIPTDKEFDEIFRVSKKHIIWGGNYFQYLTGEPTPNLKKKEDFLEYIDKSLYNWIFWWKQNPVDNFADGELAWTDLDQSYIYDYRYYGAINSEKDRMHPTQKPRPLYDFCYKKSLVTDKGIPIAGQKVGDFFLGSGSSRIVAGQYNLDFYGSEIDKDIFESQENRYKNRLTDVGLFI